MTVLLIGLAIFIGVHTMLVVMPEWRHAQIARFGLWPWRTAFGAVSLTGLALTVAGYGIARRTPVWLWFPPPWMPYLAALFMLLAAILLAAAFVHGNHFKQKLGRPLIASVLLWACAHLLANGTLHAVILFGAFFVWAALGWMVWRWQDRANNVTFANGRFSRDVATIVAGAIVWAIFAFALHGWLIGVYPLG